MRSVRTIAVVGGRALALGACGGNAGNGGPAGDQQFAGIVQQQHAADHLEQLTRHEQRHLDTFHVMVIETRHVRR